MVCGNTRWEFGQQNCRDDECDHITEISQDEWPPSTCLVHKQDRAELSDQGNDTVDTLVFQCVVATDSDLTYNDISNKYRSFDQEHSPYMVTE